MATASRFEDLEVWLLAREQAREIFQFTLIDPFSKDYSLKKQITASSGSVMDNIAEGFERSGNKEFCNFLIVAKGSNGEVRSQLYRALDYQYISEEKFNIQKTKNEILSSKINSFITYLKKSDRKGFRYE